MLCSCGRVNFDINIYIINRVSGEGNNLIPIAPRACSEIKQNNIYYYLIQKFTKKLVHEKMG